VRLWKVKAFDRWARREGLGDDDLAQAADEIASGMFEGDLGGSVIKKRVARAGGGKRGGFRTIVAYRPGSSSGMFFLHGYAKNAKADLSPRERAALQINARILLDLSQTKVRDLAADGAIVEIRRTG
jgi:hypothetical protein